MTSFNGHFKVRQDRSRPLLTGRLKRLYLIFAFHIFYAPLIRGARRQVQCTIAANN